MANWYSLQFGGVDLSPFEINELGEVRNRTRGRKSIPLSRVKISNWWKDERCLMKADIRDESDLIDPFLEELVWNSSDQTKTALPVVPRNPPRIRFLYYREHNNRLTTEQRVKKPLVYSYPEWMDLVGDPDQNWYAIRLNAHYKALWDFSAFHGPSMAEALIKNEDTILTNKAG